MSAAQVERLEEAGGEEVAAEHAGPTPLSRLEGLGVAASDVAKLTAAGFCTVECVGRVF